MAENRTTSDAGPRSIVAKLIVVVAALYFGFVAVQGISAAILLTPTHDVQDRITVRGGVIRLGPTYYLHDNTSHAAVGIVRLSLVNRCDLRIETDATDGDEIIAAIIEEDETLARLDVQAGLSGGGQYSNVKLYRSGAHVCANSRIFGPSANLWVQLTYLSPAS